ncbi:MAG: EVE domain-containing protein [Patescibacteria group bacterium]
MAYWLVKTEPQEYSWEMLEKEGKARWDGIHNHQARNHMREMKPGDVVFVYHSGDERMITGLARVASEAYPDETATTGDWLAIDIEPLKVLNRVVSFEEIKNTYGLSVMPLVSQNRLSVHPVSEAQAAMLLKIAKTEI